LPTSLVISVNFGSFSYKVNASFPLEVTGQDSVYATGLLVFGN